jgi:hypothetical protein
VLKSGSYLFTDDRCTRRGDKKRNDGSPKKRNPSTTQDSQEPRAGAYLLLFITGRRGRSLRPRSRVVSKGNGQGGCVVADRKGIGADDLRTTEV